MIDYGASFEANFARYKNGPVQRMVDGLNSLNEDYSYTIDTISPTDFVISNVDDNGNIVPPYTNIHAKTPITRQDIFDLYDVPGIGRSNNNETHIFSIDKNADFETSVTEWFAMGNARYSVFVPFYPLLTDDVFEAFKVNAPLIPSTDEQPESGVWFKDGKWYTVYPR